MLSRKSAVVKQEGDTGNWTSASQLQKKLTSEDPVAVLGT